MPLSLLNGQVEFVSAFREFCQDRGKVPDLNIRLDHQSLQLYRLWQLVLEVGGGQEVSNALLWHGLAEELLGSSENNSANAKLLKDIYYSRLLAFELMLKQEREAAIKKAKVTCFLPQPAASPVSQKDQSPAPESEAETKSRRVRSKDKHKSKKARTSHSRYALIPTATIVHAPQLHKKHKSGSPSEPEPSQMFRPVQFAPKLEMPESIPLSSEPALPRPAPTRYIEAAANNPRNIRLPSLNDGENQQLEAGAESRPPQIVPNGNQVAMPVPSSGFQPLMVSHETLRQPGACTGPQIRPMIDPFSSQTTNARLRAKMNAALVNNTSGKKEPAPLPAIPGPVPQAPLAAPRSGFKPLTVPPASDTQASPGSLARHVNRHTMLTANCNTRAHVPMMEVLTDLQEATESPRKAKRKRAGKGSAPRVRQKKRKALVNTDGQLANLASRQSTPGSILDEDQDQTTSETSEEYEAVLGRPKRNAAKKTNHETKTAQSNRKKRGRPLSTVKVKVDAHAPGERRNKLPKKSHKKGAAQWFAFLQDLQGDEAMPEILAEIKRAAVSYTFPVKSPNPTPVKRRPSPEKLTLQLLNPALENLRTLNPIIASQSLSRESSPAPQVAQAAPPAPVELSETGKVKLTDSQTRFLAHVRGQCWLEEPQESIFPKDPPAPAPVGRRSTRQRAAPVAFSPNFSGTYPRRSPSEIAAGMSVGDDFQAVLPVWRPKPAKGSEPTEEEAKWLLGLVSEPGAYGHPDRSVPVKLQRPAGLNPSQEPVRYTCGEGAQSLLDAAQIAEMGLSEMGTLSMQGWTPEDVALFERGLNENRRNFQEIANSLLPHKGCLKVCSFYYNLWKSRALPEAVRWYQQRDEAKRQAALEAEAKLAADRARVIAEKERAALARERARDRVSAEKLMQKAYREPFAWMKNVARQPHLLGTDRYDKLDMLYKARSAAINENFKNLNRKNRAFISSGSGEVTQPSFMSLQRPKYVPAQTTQPQPPTQQLQSLQMPSVQPGFEILKEQL